MKIFNIFKKNKLLSISLGLLLLFSLFLYIKTIETYALIESLSIWVRNYFGSFYLYLGLGCVLLLLAIAISPWGTYKLGHANEKPAFKRLPWIAMLYSAGMGSGILLRAVQEPVFMQQNPPLSTGISSEVIALEFTFYQWGFTAWAFYAVFALAIGYAVFHKNKTVATSSTFSLLFQKEGNGFLTGIDILTILTTIFGLVAALGLGASQIKGGLDHLFKADFSYQLIIILVIAIGVLALLSALSGVEKGIKRISTMNIYITVALLLFVFLQSDMLLIIEQLATGIYRYIIDFIPMSLAIGKFDPGIEFLTDWTYYYWAFWLAWAPFTGMFIARISKGRTIRETIIAVLLIPSLGSFFWFTTFGQSAFDMISEWGSYSGEFDNVFTSIFVFFEAYPLTSIINSIVILLLVSFLVTSVDSAIYVLSMFTDKGSQNPNKKQRLLWGIILIIFSVGIVLLGHAKEDSNVLIAMQKLLIITSLPLSLLMVLMIGLWLRDLVNHKKE
ncbi:BCCT family transporter [Marixanthomonas ophiurae]|uniref:BCCT family transporter n=1 Tax=Marixanthomonas ophiurae TaxID=387659 RepID=UPI001EFC6AF6|nr:BCCT family transporter [Marixanthomonas ophiurae]